MNTKEKIQELKDQLELVEWFNSGGKIQFKCRNGWEDVDYPMWNFNVDTYRKKLEIDLESLPVDTLKLPWIKNTGVRPDAKNILVDLGNGDYRICDDRWDWELGVSSPIIRSIILP